MPAASLGAHRGSRHERRGARTRLPRPGLWRAAARATHRGDIVVVVSADAALQRVLSDELQGNGFRAVVAESADRVADLVSRIRPVVILLDLEDARPALAQIRARSWTPVIVLSHRTTEAVKVSALDAGADDYVVKPFGPKELLARIRVALRYAPALQRRDVTLEIGRIRIDPVRYVVTVAGRQVHLTPIEFQVLALLARFRGAVVTRDQILQEVWGDDGDGPDHLRVHIAALRKKLETQPGQPRCILTIVGIGYRLAA